MGGSVVEEYSIVGIDERVGAVQGDLVASVVLAVPMFAAEESALKGMSVCVVRLGTGNELVEGMRMWIGCHQQSQWCVGFFGNGYTECCGELSDKRGLKDVRLIVE